MGFLLTVAIVKVVRVNQNSKDAAGDLNNKLKHAI